MKLGETCSHGCCIYLGTVRKYDYFWKKPGHWAVTKDFKPFLKIPEAGSQEINVSEPPKQIKINLAIVKLGGLDKDENI